MPGAQEQKNYQFIMHQITKIRIIINNIIQDQVVVIGKVTTNQIEIIDIINSYNQNNRF